MQILPPEQHEGCNVEIKLRLHFPWAFVYSEVLEYGSGDDGDIGR